MLMVSHSSTFRYAGTVMEVYKVNEELNSQLREVSQFTAQFATTQVRSGCFYEVA